MKRNEPVSHIMSRHVVTAHHGDPISRVRPMIQEKGVHHIPVVSGEAIVGIVTWSDILRVSFGDAFSTDQRSVDATLDHSMALEDLMQKDPVTIEEDAAIREAATVMVEKDLHALPVTRNGRLVGMLTGTDLIKYLLEQF
jgi:predicted transcriptional regulator